MNQLNAVYNPMFQALSKEVGLDALDYGLSGNIIFTDVNATASSGSTYWSTSLQRSRTIKESMDALLADISRIENLVADIELSTSTSAAADPQVSTNKLNISQLRKDTMGDNYTLDGDGLEDLTYSLSEHIDKLGSFFSGFPGTGNGPYTGSYPSVSLNVNLSDINVDATLPQSRITNLTDHLNYIRGFIGKSIPGLEVPTYSDHGAISFVSDGQSLEVAIQTLDAAVASSGAVFAATPSGGGENIINNSGTSADLSSDDFCFGSDSLEDDGLAQHDSRMFFDKSKGAFRAGQAQGSQWNNTNRGNNSIAMGKNTVAAATASTVGGGDDNGINSSGSYGVISGGSSNSVSAQYGTINGGLQNTASADYAIASGFGAVGEVSRSDTFSSGYFSTPGDAQRIEFTVRGTTTDATPTEIFLDGSSEQFIPQDGATYAVSIMVVARQTGGAAGTVGDSIYEETKLAVQRTSGTTAGIPGGSSTSYAASAGVGGWSFSAGIDGTTQAVTFTVTGEASKNISWMCRVEAVKLAG
jgi:hypothetical protein